MQKNYHFIAYVVCAVAILFFAAMYFETEDRKADYLLRLLESDGQPGLRIAIFQEIKEKEHSRFFIEIVEKFRGY